MSSVLICSASDPEWDDLVEACSFHDAYHHADYHRAMAGNGRPILIAGGHEGAARWAMPLVLHPIADAVPGADGHDAISVYGFTGIAWSPECEAEYLWPAVWRDVGSALRNLGVVSAFLRLHPLDPFRGPWPDSSSLIEGGRTVLVTSMRRDDAMIGYGKAHRYDVRRAVREGLAVRWTQDASRLTEFLDIYEATMRRNEAASSYFFERDRLRQLVSSGRFTTWTGAVEEAERVLAMSLFLAHPPFAHYFLSGSRRTEHGSRPSKMLIHEARQFLGEAGCSVLQLGGGVGSREDSLFRFKSGFSDERTVFRSLRWVVDPSRYALVLKCWSGGHAAPDDLATGWFPAYRTPRSR